MSVSTVPGASALARIPRGAKSAAIARVNAISAALAPEYIATLRREEERAGGDDVDDRRARALGQVRERLLHEEHRAAQVDAVGLVPRLGRERPERQRQRVRRVVDHDVDAAEPVDSLGPRARRGRRGHRGASARRAPRHPCPSEVRLGLLARLGLAARDDDLRARPTRTPRRPRARCPASLRSRWPRDRSGRRASPAFPCPTSAFSGSRGAAHYARRPRRWSPRRAARRNARGWYARSPGGRGAGSRSPTRSGRDRRGR